MNQKEANFKNSLFHLLIESFHQPIKHTSFIRSSSLIYGYILENKNFNISFVKKLYQLLTKTIYYHCLEIIQKRVDKTKKEKEYSALVSNGSQLFNKTNSDIDQSEDIENIKRLIFGEDGKTIFITKIETNNAPFKQSLTQSMENLVELFNEYLNICEEDINLNDDKNQIVDFLIKKKAYYNNLFELFSSVLIDKKDNYSFLDILTFINNIYSYFNKKIYQNDDNSFKNNLYIFNFNDQTFITPIQEIFTNLVYNDNEKSNIFKKIEDLFGFINKFYVTNISLLNNDDYTQVNKYFRYYIIQIFDAFFLSKYFYTMIDDIISLIKFKFVDRLLNSTENVENLNLNNTFNSFMNINDTTNLSISQVRNKTIEYLMIINNNHSNKSNKQVITFNDKHIKPTTVLTTNQLSDILVSKLNNPQVYSMPPIFQEFNKFGGFYGGDPELNEISQEEFNELLRKIRNNISTKDLSNIPRIINQIQDMIDTHNKYVKTMNELLKDIGNIKQKYNSKLNGDRREIIMGGEDSTDIIDKMKYYNHLNTNRHMLESNIIEKFNSLY